jgi:hypothetical protein
MNNWWKKLYNIFIFDVEIRCSWKISRSYPISVTRRIIHIQSLVNSYNLIIVWPREHQMIFHIDINQVSSWWEHYFLISSYRNIENSVLIGTLISYPYLAWIVLAWSHWYIIILFYSFFLRRGSRSNIQDGQDNCTTKCLRRRLLYNG